MLAPFQTVIVNNEIATHTKPGNTPRNELCVKLTEAHVSIGAFPPVHLFCKSYNWMSCCVGVK